MNTTFYDNNLILAEAYYDHMLKKNFDDMEKCLHPDIQFTGPLSEMSGRTAVVEAAKGLSAILENIEIRAKFCSENQVMLAYDFKFLEPICLLRAAVLMEFKDLLISKIELFFDSKPFNQKETTSS